MRVRAEAGWTSTARVAASGALLLALGSAPACHKYVSVEAQHLADDSSQPLGLSAPGGPRDPHHGHDDERHARERLDVTGPGATLERVTADPVDEFAPAISRDGKALLFQVETYDTGAETKLKQQTLVGVDPSTRGQRTLYTSSRLFANNPAWMPDGNSYLYVTNSMGPYAIVRALTAAPNAAIQVVLSSDMAPQPSHPSPSPDGTRIAFSTTGGDGVHSICTVGIDGSKFTVIGEGRTPSFAPDGGTIAFVRNVSGYDQIFLVDPEKGASLVELTSGNADSQAPTWSPDGKYLAFASNLGYAELGRKREEVLHLFVMKRDGTGLVQLTNGQAISGAPTWSPDGWLYFSSNQAGNYDIWRIKLNGEHRGALRVRRCAARQARARQGERPSSVGAADARRLHEGHGLQRRTRLRIRTMRHPRRAHGARDAAGHRPEKEEALISARVRRGDGRRAIRRPPRCRGGRAAHREGMASALSAAAPSASSHALRGDRRERHARPHR